MGANITVHYPFHPLYGQTLAVASKARRADGAETVVAQDGSQLKIPTWMTTPEAEGHAVSHEVAIGPQALLKLLEVVSALTAEGLAPLSSSATPGEAMLGDAKRRTCKTGRERASGAGQTGRKADPTEPRIEDGPGNSSTSGCLARKHRGRGDRAARRGNQDCSRGGRGGGPCRA